MQGLEGASHNLQRTGQETGQSQIAPCFTNQSPYCKH